MSSPSHTQIKSTASPSQMNLSSITSAAETPLPTTETTKPTLPPASAFSILPDLYVLISRLSELRNPPQEINAVDNLTQTLSRESNASLRQLSSSEKLVETRDLPGHIFGLKRRITEARRIVQELEDGSRTVEEQEAEMDVLRGRIAGSKMRLGELGTICARGNGGDVLMEGVE